jgi:hypothetical protein
MRVLAQAMTAAPGGSVTVLRDLVANWDERDELVVLCWREEVAQMLRATGADVDRIHATSTAEALLKLSIDRQLVQRHSPDVVWSQALRVPFVGPQVLHLRDIGVFDRSHRTSPREVARRTQIRRDIRRVDRTIVNSMAMAAAVRASSRRLADLPLEVVPNGLDLEMLLRIPPAEATSDRELRILLPQSDHPHKRSHLAAEVLERVISSLPRPFMGARLIVPGGSPHLPLREALAARGLRERADFPGQVDRTGMAALYGACDVVLITSATESFCNPAIEAAAAGRRLVAPPLPVLHETGGPMALLVPSAHPDDLAAGVVSVAGRGTDVPLTDQARTHARRFTADSSASAIRRVLERLVRRPMEDR